MKRVGSENLLRATLAAYAITTLPLSLASPFVELATSKYHTCGRRANGKINCWGENDAGQLGLGNTVDTGYFPNTRGKTYTNVAFPSGHYAKTIAVGEGSSCAVLDDDTVVCWGIGEHGQLGNGNLNWIGNHDNEMGNNLVRVQLRSGVKVDKIYAGNKHYCVITKSPIRVYCWGANSDGQCGVGHTTDVGGTNGNMGSSHVVTDLGSNNYAKSLALGAYHSCAIRNDNRVVCWGQNEYGQGGSGNTLWYGNAPNEMGNNLVPVAFPSGNTATQIVAGSYHTCARMTNGRIYCWGANSYGNLGIGNTNNVGLTTSSIGLYFRPTDIGSGKYATSLIAGRNHVCAERNTGDVVCWGYNDGHALGRGDISDTAHIGNQAYEMGDYLRPVEFPAGRSIKHFSAAGLGWHTCAIMDDDNVVCWGWNESGQCGIGHIYVFTPTRQYDNNVRITCSVC